MDSSTSDNCSTCANISQGTTAEQAYKLFLDKKQQIATLEYECDLLVDKYHSEMCKAVIPLQLDIDFIADMFDSDANKRNSSRKLFLNFAFSQNFLDNHNIEFIGCTYHGYRKTAIGITLAIGDYEYTIECPVPKNIYHYEDKKLLVGQVKFRVDRIHKSQTKNLVRVNEVVQFPTYNWKLCFDAIEKKVAEN